MTPTNQRLPNRRFRRLLPAAVATAALATTFTPLVAPAARPRGRGAARAGDESDRAADHAARGPRRREDGATT